MNPHMLRKSNRKGTILLVASALLATTIPGFCDAAAVTGAISDVATDAGTGVTAGVGIGAVVFGGKVVWGAIKSMAS